MSNANDSKSITNSCKEQSRQCMVAAPTADDRPYQDTCMTQGCDEKTTRCVQYEGTLRSHCKMHFSSFPETLYDDGSQIVPAANTQNGGCLRFMPIWQALKSQLDRKKKKNWEKKKEAMREIMPVLARK